MDELELIRSFRRDDATPSPQARAAAGERLAAHIAGDSSAAASSRRIAARQPAEWFRTDRAALASGTSTIAAHGAARRFNDEQDVYQYLGRFFQNLVADDGAFPEFQKVNTVLQFSMRQPMAQITVKMTFGEDGQVDFGATDLLPEVVLTMDATTAYDFCLGKVNVTVALARGQMKAKGPVAKILKVLTLAKPIFARDASPAQVRTEGRRSRISHHPAPPDELSGGRILVRTKPISARHKSPARRGWTRRPDETGMPGDPSGRQMAGFKAFYQFIAPTRVIAGRDLIASVGFEFGKEGANRVLIVTDESLRATGLIDRAEAGVADGGLEVSGVFDRVPQDSDAAVVDAVAEMARELGADAILAVGGGSVIDTAKLANVVFVHGGHAREWEGYYDLPRANDGQGRPLELAPLACIPTTAGSGSEVSFVAVIKDRKERLKFQVGDVAMFPALAILDPEATRTLPPVLAAATGMDAMSHAIEAYASRDWNPHSDAYAMAALRLLRDNLQRAVEHPDDDEARGNMLIAASLAMQAASCGAIGIVHSMSHACGAHSDVPHGVANAINLPWVIEYNAAAGEDIAARYRDINDVLGLETLGRSDSVGHALAEHLRGLVHVLALPTRLSQVGVTQDDIPDLVDGAMGDACTLVNPREPTEHDLALLYRRAL